MDDSNTDTEEMNVSKLTAYKLILMVGRPPHHHGLNLGLKVSSRRGKIKLSLVQLLTLLRQSDRKDCWPLL